MSEEEKYRPDLDAICSLITACAEGKTTDETVEDAVARLVVPGGGGSSSENRMGQSDKGNEIGQTANGATGAGEYEEEDDDDDNSNSDNEEEEEDDDDDDDDDEKIVIDEDMENYDEEEEEDDAVDDAAPKEQTPDPPKRRGRKRKAVAGDKLPPPDWSIYEEIPLGKQGAKMLATFGDSRTPLPETVQAALEGTKLLVQAAVDDARRIRDQYSSKFQNARKSFRNYRPSKPLGRGEWSAELMYRAMCKNTRTTTAGQGGFDVEELKTLYPEELTVYERWRTMREKAEKSKGNENAEASKPEADNDEDDEGGDKDDEGEGKKEEDEALNSGHLNERSVQFDKRTVRMKKNQYLQFSQIRRGSFLAETAKPQEYTKGDEAKRWAKMSPVYAQFLHWAGFDPLSSMVPPNDATTEALGFLAYNFLGRIVEKAVSLRNEARKRKTAVVEVGKGDKLEPADIERAMKEPDVQPTRLFNGTKVGTQLYFGPGFENRLELELEEMVNAAKSRGPSKDSAGDDLLAHFAPSEDEKTSGQKTGDD